MSGISIVREILAVDADIIAVVAQRIFPIELPQKIQLPAIVLSSVDEIDGRHLSGSDRYPVSRFIVDCVAATYQAADVLGDDVRDTLIDYRGSIAGFEVDDIAHDGVDFFDRGETGDAWRRRLGFRMRFRAT
ncbi:hypothetical protein FHT87_004592 [Rhizobium sp. BK316]|uniref:tail completion protein gp17 n=1 Tax=Rhizobium sp. BK316 TaxID=2587053 RepID=UPI0016096324|nr:DUF3168 domain-containing protein [Rhizobium sp. BK316]MBB3410660.1 hypothetical protein [Rhizobium sp. BK316]